MLKFGQRIQPNVQLGTRDYLGEIPQKLSVTFAACVCGILRSPLTLT